jgi:hypothetical protein
MRTVGKGGAARWRGAVWTVVAFLAMTVLLVFGLRQVDARHAQEQARVLENAVLRATLTCYAVEGRYPASVDYLKEHYGIVYDEDHYIVTLDSFASNLLPTIFVLTQGGVGDEP